PRSREGHSHDRGASGRRRPRRDVGSRGRRVSMSCDREERTEGEQPDEVVQGGKLRSSRSDELVPVAVLPQQERESEAEGEERRAERRAGEEGRRFKQPSEDD